MTRPPFKAGKLYTPLAWAAGVLDAGGRFYLVDGAKGITATVRVCAPLPTLKAFASEMGLNLVWPEDCGVLVIKPEWQEGVLGRLIPYMVGQVEAASAIYRYRLTAPTRRVGWKLTTPVKAYREKLKEKLA